jgi:hypothetical protein
MRANTSEHWEYTLVVPQPGKTPTYFDRSARDLNFPIDGAHRVVSVLKEYGNTRLPSMGIALDSLRRSRRIVCGATTSLASRFRRRFQRGAPHCAEPEPGLSPLQIEESPCPSLSLHFLTFLPKMPGHGTVFCYSFRKWQLSRQLLNLHAFIPSYIILAFTITHRFCRWILI